MSHISSESQGADIAQSRLATTASLVAAYVSNNSIRSSDLTSLIESVYNTLGHLSVETLEADLKEEAPLVPAVPVKKSITPDFLICLEDGKKFRSLKRHLGSVYNLSPDEYRAKWRLPRDYPMVAPAYSAVRSKLAKEIGLGRPAKAATKSAAVAEKRSVKVGSRTKKAANSDG